MAPQPIASFLNGASLQAFVGSTQTVTRRFDAAGHATRRFSKDGAGQAVIASGTPGDTLLAPTLPFGSFSITQTPVDVVLTLGVSKLADAVMPLALQATGGRAHGAAPFNNPTTDPVISGPNVHPTVAGCTRSTWGGAEQEAATGPSYPRQWEVQGTVHDVREFAPT